MNTIYRETLKLTDFELEVRTYDFADAHSNLSIATQELMFSSAFVVYNQLLSELSRPAVAKQQSHQQALHIAQTPFPIWLTSLTVEKEGISDSLHQRWIEPTKAMFKGTDIQDVLHRLLYEVVEQLKREVSYRVERGETERLEEVEISWSILNLSIYRVVRDI